MAATVSIKQSSVPGASVQQQSLVTGDASYPNPAGYVFTPGSFGFSILRKIVGIEPATLAAGLYSVVVIPTFASDGTISSFAVHLFVTSTGLEVANAVNVSTSSFLFLIEGN